MEMSPDSPTPPISSWPAATQPLPSDPLPFDPSEVEIAELTKASAWETVINWVVFLFLFSLVLLITWNWINRELPLRTMMGMGN